MLFEPGTGCTHNKFQSFATAKRASYATGRDIEFCQHCGHWKFAAKESQRPLAETAP